MGLGVGCCSKKKNEGREPHFVLFFCGGWWWCKDGGFWLVLFAYPTSVVRSIHQIKKVQQRKLSTTVHVDTNTFDKASRRRGDETWMASLM